MKAHRSGFTLIELLVVIVIIVVLMGIALQVAKTANDRTRRAQTVRTMQSLRNALAGYYAAYGQYPPTSETGGTYPSSNGLLRLSGASLAEQDNLPGEFRHGLLYYLMAYNAPNEPATPLASTKCNAWYPRSAEKATAERWRHYLEGVPGIHVDGRATNLNLTGSTGGHIGTTNSTFSALDGWGSSIQYTSPPPDYQSFRLWSVHMTNGWEE